MTDEAVTTATAETPAADGSLAGPGFTSAEAAFLPDHLRLPGVVVTDSSRPA